MGTRLGYPKVERQQDVVCHNTKCRSCDPRTSACLIHVQVCRDRQRVAAPINSATSNQTTGA